MQFAIRVLLVFAVAAFLLPQPSKASVVFKPGKKPEYVGPGGEEEESGEEREIPEASQRPASGLVSHPRAGKEKKKRRQLWSAVQVRIKGA